jgi:hypothetical protein
MNTRSCLIVAASCVGIAAALGVQADTVQVKLAADLGLWEVTSHGQMSGDTDAMMERLQSLPPERRARLEAALKAAQQKSQQGRKFKECMTPERRARGFSVSEDNPACKTTILTNTSSELEVRRECVSDEGQEQTTEHFHKVDSRHVTGTVEMVRSRGEKSMTMHSTIEGTWLAADCGNVKDVEVEK